MVTDCGSTLGGVWVLFWFCSAILVCVSVVSRLVFGVIWPWNISASFLSASSFYVYKGENRSDDDGFLAHNQVCCRMVICIIRVNSWHRSVLRKESDHVWNEFLSCAGNAHFITPVVPNCWSYVPALYPMLTPCAPYFCCLVEYELGDWWCQRYFVEVKTTPQYFVL